jgi:hypothetical protein
VTSRWHTKKLQRKTHKGLRKVKWTFWLFMDCLLDDDELRKKVVDWNSNVENVIITESFINGMGIGRLYSGWNEYYC